jgi:pyruvate dehydrogenase E2 component (dihydrolipoamide acetyltransferase)
MATQIKMPKLGMTMKTGTVAGWLKQEGDPVKRGEVLAEIETEKITHRIEARAEGILLKIVAPRGTKLPVGGLMGIIGEPGEDVTEILAAAPAASPEAPSRQAGHRAEGQGSRGEARARKRITPVARRLAEDRGIDYTSIVGSGPDGRITREDVEKALQEGASEARESDADPRATRSVIPLEGMRRAVAENMVKSSCTNAMVTHHVKVDMSGVLALRSQMNAGRSDSAKISVTAILIKAVAQALEIDPCLNASLIGEEIRVWQSIHIGMAVAVQGGLVVPVVRDANQKALTEVNEAIQDLAHRAREQELSLDEMSGATFTVTSLASQGSVDFFTPIINPPEVAILGVGRTQEQPAVVEGKVVVRPLMGLSLTFDHRVVDGAPAASWLGVLIRLVERPVGILI